MAALDHFLAMGGYARFVWPAYAIAVSVMGGLLIESIVTYRKRRRALDAAEKRPAMTRKRKRLYIVVGGLALLGAATALVLSAFSDNLVFFYGPSDLVAKHVPDGRDIRIGGLVENGSVKKEADGVTLDFKVTDGNTALPVTYKGDVPDLFREGQGVVVEGKLQHGTFRADSVLAKHDETYMPPEVVDELKRSGHWQGERPDASAADAKKPSS